MCATSVESSGGGDIVQLEGDGLLVGSSAESVVIGGVDPLVGSLAEGAASQCKAGVGDVVAMVSPPVGGAEGRITGGSAVLLTDIGNRINTVGSGLKYNSRGLLLSSRRAGLSLSMLTLCWAFPTEKVKYF